MIQVYGMLEDYQRFVNQTKRDTEEILTLARDALQFEYTDEVGGLIRSELYEVEFRHYLMDLHMRDFWKSTLELATIEASKRSIQEFIDVHSKSAKKLNERLVNWEAHQREIINLLIDAEISIGEIKMKVNNPEED